MGTTITPRGFLKLKAVGDRATYFRADSITQVSERSHNQTIIVAGGATTIVEHPIADVLTLIAQVQR